MLVAKKYICYVLKNYNETSLQGLYLNMFDVLSRRYLYSEWSRHQAFMSTRPLYEKIKSSFIYCLMKGLLWSWLATSNPSWLLKSVTVKLSRSFFVQCSWQCRQFSGRTCQGWVLLERWRTERLKVSQSLHTLIFECFWYVISGCSVSLMKELRGKLCSFADFIVK